MSERIENVACTICGCVCDDLRISVESGRIVQAEGACHLAEPWFLSQGDKQPPQAEINGQSASVESALDRAVDILRTARAPLILGLSRCHAEGQRAALDLADRLGAIVDVASSPGLVATTLAVQEVGESTCSLGEVRHYADLVLFWGCDPVQTHPRHFERYSVDPPGLFVPKGRADRTLVVVDTQPTATSSRADVFVRLEPGGDFEAIGTLRGLLRDREPSTDAGLGAVLPALRDIVQRMKTCRCGIVFFGDALSRPPVGHRSVEALLRLVADLNAFTRFYAQRMSSSWDAMGAENVLTWQTGYPLNASFARGYPRYNPGEFSANELLLRDEVDVCLLVGSHGIEGLFPAAISSLRSLPTIVLDPPTQPPLVSPTVRFTTAIAGIHVPSVAHRMDGALIPMRPLLPTQYPCDADILRQMLARL